MVNDIELPAQFSAEVLGASWIDDTHSPGARFRGRNRYGAIGERETISDLCRYEPPRHFALNVGDLKAETLVHSRVATTLDIYAHVLDELNPDTANRMDVHLTGATNTS